MAHCAQQLNQIGIKTYIVPEAHSLLCNGGVSVNTNSLDSAKTVKYYANLIRTQMALEDILIEIGSSFYPDDRVVVLCDRGVMDCSSLMDKSTWQALLDETGWSNTELRDKRYDLVIHLVTAADEAEEFYRCEGKETIEDDDIQEAIKIDRKLQIAWIGHPLLMYL